MKPVNLGHMLVRKFEEDAGVTVPIPIGIFPGLTSERFKELQEDLDPRAFVAATETLPFSMHTYVLQTRNRVILIDTCNGNDKVRTGVMEGSSMLKNKYIENLAALGLMPEDVDMVLCTHLHSDHVGWNTKMDNGRWVPTFPNARYLFGRIEYEHWSKAADDEDRQILVDSVQPVVDAGLVTLVDSTHRITDEVWLEPTPGHTPGHVSVRISSRGHEAVITGDLMHHPIQCCEPQLGSNFDSDAEQARQTRLEFLQRYGDSKVMVFGTHFAPPTAGWLTRHGEAWAFGTHRRMLAER